jgi:hypothetical protein
MSEHQKLRFAFLDIGLFDNNTAFRGALLITDVDTKPHEFRITGPIRPSSLQRILYGSTLEEYVRVDLICVPLINASKEKPSLILVSTPILLQVRPKVSSPVVLLRQNVSTAPGTSSELNKTAKRPFTITSHHDFLNEADSAQALLESIMQTHDLLEPFERIKIALNEAHQQKIGEATTKN